MIDPSAPACPTDALPLPTRPALLPGLELLDRGGGEVQVGLDPRHAVVVGGLPPDVVTALGMIDGQRSIHTLLALAESEHRPRLRTVLAGLTVRGLLTESPWPAPAGSMDAGLWSLHTGRSRDQVSARRGDGVVTVRGDGRLAVAIATMLAKAGVGHVAVNATGVVGETDLGSGFVEADLGRPKRQALADAVRRANPATRTTRLAGRRPELVLLTDAVVPAPDLVHELVVAGKPHLPVRVRDGTAIVGPLVVPGRSSCLRCADLRRTALDDAWPRVASQLAGKTQVADLAVVQACASLAVAQTLRLLSPGPTAPPVWNATLELDLYVGRVRQRWWPPHPACGCGAPCYDEAPTA